MSDNTADRPTENEQPDRKAADGGTAPPFDSLSGTDSTDALDPSLREALGVPAGRPAEVVDVRRAGPPEPLRRTLETLEGSDDATVLLQRNDRLPAHLFDRIERRGYRYGAVERGDEVLTAIWRN